MKAPVLQLDRPPSSVTVPVWSGRLSIAGQQRDVLVVLGPQGVTEVELRQANTDARQVLVLRRSGVVPLLLVIPHEGRVAWVYERIEGVALSWFTTQSAEHLPPQVAAALVGRLAMVLAGSGPIGATHPGPTAQSVVIDRAGRPSVLGFVGPDPVAEAMHAPGDSASAGAVFRLGVLLAHLLGGVSPGRAVSREAHPSYLRRVEVRALERANDQLSPDLIAVLQAMLAWDDADRPALVVLSDSLHACVDGESHTILRRWAERWVDSALRDEAGGQAGDIDLPGTLAQDFGDFHDDVTLPGVPDFTQAEPKDAVPDAVVEVTETASPSERRGTRPRSPATQPIPVSVGPPPGAIPKPVRLPAGFGRQEITFPEPAYVDVTETETGFESGLGWPWWVWVVWGAVTGCLLAAVAGLALFLLLW